jgi:branched-subunit amino acid aminotransferase/4-amino-4-deoxychorismate lyase
MNGLEIRVELVPVQKTYEADEIFMCTTAGGIMPITSLDGSPVNGGEVGPITKRIWDGYWDIHYDEAFSFEIEYNDGNRNTSSGPGL